MRKNLKTNEMAMVVITGLFFVAFANAQETQGQGQSQNQIIVIKQPKTVVEAAPLEESQAEKMRKNRQEVEVQTEQKIVEKLEESRLEDEKSRYDKLFGERMKKEEPKKEEPAPVVAPAPVATPPPAPAVVVVEEKKVTPEDLANTKKEIIEAIKENKPVEQPREETVIRVEAPVAEVVKPEEAQERYYVSGLLGTADYPSAANVEGKGAGGFLVGVELGNNMVVEGGMVYSNYFLEDYYWITGPAIFKEIDQYNLGLAVKYSPLKGRIKPLVGIGMNYTHRKYYDRMVYTWSGWQMPADNEVTSNAVDLMALIGVDIEVSNSFSIGLEYRYNTNMVYRSESEFVSQRYRAAGARLLEETDYSILTLNGKIRF